MPTTRASTPDVTVLVTGGQDDPALTRTLASLAAQTLDVDRFEVVVVAGSVADHPALHLRLLEAGSSNSAHARNLGVSLARGRHLTFLESGDEVSATFLEAMLAAAAPGRVPVASAADLPDAPDLAAALASYAAKLVPASLARVATYPTDLSQGAEQVYWARLFAASHFRVQVVPDAVHQRAAADASEPAYATHVTPSLDCLTVLGQLDATAPSTRELVGALVTRQSAVVNDYLLAHPAEHARVRADVHDRGLLTIDWSRANRGLAKELAVLYCFTPYVDTSGVVSARRIRDHGVVVDLITKDLSDLRVQDVGSSRIAAEYVAAWEAIPGRSSFNEWGPVRWFTEQSLERFAALEKEFGPYPSLYSRAMWGASNIVGALIKLRRPEIHWRAEFSDPLLHNINGNVRGKLMQEGPIVDELRAGLAAAGFTPPEKLRLFDWAEKLAYGLADEILFTNENQQRYMLDYCSDRDLAVRAASIASVSHHPTLPPEFYRMAEVDYELEPGRAHLGYFGVFYPTRGLTELSGAFALLSPEERARIQLHVFTAKPDDVRAEVAAAGLDDVIRVSGYVPFLTFLRMTTLFDALVVNDANTDGHHEINPYLPSKLSDYLGSGTPIWAINEPGSVLSGIETAYATTLGDTEGAAGVLRRVIAASA